jgi:hypothetical protein
MEQWPEHMARIMLAIQISERNLLFAGGVIGRIGGIGNGERGALILKAMTTQTTPNFSEPCETIKLGIDAHSQWYQPPFPALRSDPMARSGASRRKQISAIVSRLARQCVAKKPHRKLLPFLIPLPPDATPFLLPFSIPILAFPLSTSACQIALLCIGGTK